MFFLSLQYHQPFEKESDNTAYNYLGKAILKNCVGAHQETSYGWCNPHTAALHHEALCGGSIPQWGCFSATDPGRLKLIQQNREILEEILLLGRTKGHKLHRNSFEITSSLRRRVQQTSIQSRCCDRTAVHSWSCMQHSTLHYNVSFRRIIRSASEDGVSCRLCDINKEVTKCTRSRDRFVKRERDHLCG